MKTIKLTKEHHKIDRDLIKSFGEIVYACEDVKSVLVKISFRDGSNVGFKRCEEEDEFESLIKESDEDEN